jgi:hypothetical protein
MPKLSKIIIFIAFATFTAFNCCPANAQQSATSNRYSFVFSKSTIRAILDSIRLKTNFGVSYNPDILPSEKVFTASFHNIPVTQILDSVIASFGLNYKIIGTTVAISLSIKNNNTPNPDPVFEMDTVSVLKFTGRLEDLKNRETLPYASIFIKNKAIGTISNIDGNFAITLPRRFSDDSLFFSFLGYQTVTRKISDLVPDGNVISMKPQTIELKEVVIRNYKAADLIRKTIENIPQNYSTIPLFQTSFYRETLQQNGQYVLLSEAVLKIYKAPYSSFQNDQVSIYKCRKIPIAKTMDTILFKLQGGIYNSLMIDIAKNHSNFMSGENFDLYEYKFDEIISIQGHLAYVVDFDQKDGINYALYKGKIYIDTESLAIIRAEFKLSPKGISYAAETMVKKSPPGVKVRPVEANYLVNYTERNNRWYLGNIREEVVFKVRKRFNLFNITFHSIAEMAITNSDSLDVKRFKFGEIVKSNDIFAEKLIHYDPQFWGKFNYIPPDLSIEEAIAEIREKMGKSGK